MLAIVVALIAGTVAIAWLIGRERSPMDDHARATAPGAFVPLTHGVTHYTLHGPTDGPVVVFVPGATLACWIWGDLPERVADAGYRVVTYDLFGRGYSDRPNKRYDMDFHVGQLRELIITLGLRTPPTLVGLAFGCLVAGEYANRHPSDVERLVLIAPDGFGVVMRGLASLVHRPVIGPLVLGLVGDRAMLRRLGTYAADPAVVDWLRGRMARDLIFKGFKRAVSRSVRNMPIHDAKERIYARASARLGERLTVIWGRDDRVTPMPDEAFVRRIFERGNLRFLRETGHLPHVEQPHQMLPLFLEALPALPPRAMPRHSQGDR